MPPEPRTAQNDPMGAIWEPFCHQSSEKLQMNPWRSSGSHSATRAQNNLKYEVFDTQALGHNVKYEVFRHTGLRTQRKILGF